MWYSQKAQARGICHFCHRVNLTLHGACHHILDGVLAIAIEISVTSSIAGYVW